MKRTLFSFLLVLLVNVGVSAQQDSLKVLFVGNSYTYYENLTQVVSLISEKTNTKLITKKSTIGGAKWSEHWNAQRGLKSKEMIENGDYDIVVLQEYSLGAINDPDSLRIYGKLFCDLVKKHKAKPYLYLTWAREKVPQYQEVINKLYTEVGDANQAVVVPVGQAWALARELRSDIQLFTPDGSHPSPMGTFLTACVFVAALTNELPEDLPTTYTTKDKDGEYIEMIRLDKLDIFFCQMVARKIVFGE